MAQRKKKCPPVGHTYPVGYCKPPTKTQFPNQSRNLLGRPKGCKDGKTILTKLLNKRVRPMVNGKETPMAMVELFFHSLLTDAAKGKAGARRDLLSLLKAYGFFDPGPPEGTHGVLVVHEVEEDEEKWSRRAVAEHEALRKYFGLPPLGKPADAPAEKEADKPAPQGPKVRARVRVRVVPGKKIGDGT
ncbi:MAG: DUF5681 domain-containing protein [Pirellulaceae bacterium]